MEDLKVYQRFYENSPAEIAEALQTIAGTPAETQSALSEGVYYLQAIAQNHYNNDYFRVLYNVLQIITEKTL